MTSRGACERGERTRAVLDSQTRLTVASHVCERYPSRSENIMLTADEFRELALALEGAAESSHMGHPDFRANGRIFATLHTDDTLGMVKLLPDEQRALLRSHPTMFVPSPGAWGRSGCTNIRLAIADEAVVRGAVLLAWQHVMDAPPPKTRRSPAARAAPKRTTARSRTRR